MDSDEFFDQVGDRADAIVAGRYRLPHPVTGEERSWTRATTHAGLPEDSYALARWQLRQLLLGLRRRPDLLRLIESWTDDPGRAELDQVIQTAHEVAGNDAAANLGAAVHGALQRVDRSWATAPVTQPTGHGDWTRWFAEVGVPEWALPHARGYVDELARHGLTPISDMVERRVINTDLECAGTLDNLYAESDGTVVLGDKKTGRLDYPERKYAVQLAVYRDSDYLLDDAGGPPVDLASVGLRREYAVLVHVDPETGACSVYRIDLQRGRIGANLAVETREWRRERHFLLPYVSPTVGLDSAAAAWNAAERGRHLAAVPDSPTIGETRNVGAAVVQWDGQVWVPVGETVDQRLRSIVADGAEKQPSADPGTHAVSGGVADEPQNDEQRYVAESPGRAPAATMDDLMKLSKAELQRVLRSLDPGASVAHQRRILADKIVTLQNGGRVASTTPGSAALAKVRADGGLTNTPGPKDPNVIEAGHPGLTGEDPTDPRSPAFHRARLAEVAAAASVADLGRIHARVVKAGGDQAWTDQLTEAARARAAQLDAMDRPPYRPQLEWRGRVVDVLQAIREADTSADMADIWLLVTVGGSDESRWTAEVNEAAHARLTSLQAAAEQAPPNTPFGPAR